MLRVSKTTTVTGESTIDDKRVIYMNATISEESNGSANISQHVENRKLYSENKEECRKDIDEFTKQVRDAEDELIN